MLPDYKPHFPVWAPKPLAKALAPMETDAINLLQVIVISFVQNSKYSIVL
jgi:hypothetical protein